MTKLLALVIIGIMLIQVIKPLGWPGLKRRGDFWKIAAIALLVMALAGGFHLHEG